MEWYYVVEDMLKLHPGQLMELYDFVVNGKGKLGMMDGMMTTTTTTTSHKAAVKAFVARLGEWFDNNGETLGETVTFVISERGEGGEEEEEDVRGWGDLVL